MLEQTKEIVRSFNNIYGKTLVEPEILLPDNKLCSRLPGLDGNAKMSKSLGNCIYLADSEEEIEKKIMSMYTDPTHIKVEDPGHTENNPVFIYLEAFSKDSDFAKYWPEFKNLDELKKAYEKGGIGDMKVKRFLNNIMQDLLSPIRERRIYWTHHIPEVYQILKNGTEKARQKAIETTKEVKAAMGINYFEDDSWIKEQEDKFN